MKDTDIIEDKFGEIELKLLKDKVLKDVENILNQVSDKDEDFLYPVVDIHNPVDIKNMKNPLIEGEFMGHMYEIYANGSYPSAYVNWGSCDMDKNACNDLPVHGGCTYTGKRDDSDYIWYGWNYGHSGDFDKPCSATPKTMRPYKKGKKWTAIEVMKDVIRAISFIEKNR